MIKKIILTKDEFPLDAIASLKEDTKNAIILLHNDCIKRFINTCSKQIPYSSETLFFFGETDEYPETSLTIVNYFTLKLNFNLVKEIKAEDIAFTKIPEHPEIVFVIQPDFENDIADGKQMYIPESVNPFDFMLNMCKEDKTFILPKYLLDRLIDKKDAVTIQKYGRSVDIKWNGSRKSVEMLEISNDRFVITSLIDDITNNIVTSSNNGEKVYLA